MWPKLERNDNKIGCLFNPEFWDLWGPTKIVHYDSENLNDSRKIQSIYLIDKEYHSIKIPDNKVIAMALTYKCGDFGEHTVIFSYDKQPKITLRHSGNYCIFEDFSSTNVDDINLYNLGVLDKDINKLSKEAQSELYLEYLEDFFRPADVERSIFRGRLRDYINASESFDTYKSLLEVLLERDNGGIYFSDMFFSDDLDFFIYLETIQQQIRRKSKDDFFAQMTSAIKRIGEQKEINDLNAIFRNARDLLAENVFDENGQPCKLEISPDGTAKLTQRKIEKRLLPGKGLRNTRSI